jgi:Uma2 family endonuclease
MGMAAKSFFTPERYLAMSFPDGDREYVDGILVERHVGERPHSKVQRNLTLYFGRRPGLHCYPELRMPINARRYRAPDFLVFSGSDPLENVPKEAPLIVVEVLSSDDRMREVIEKLDDYRSRGVPHIWLADPWKRKLFLYGETGLHEAPVLEVPELEIRIGPENLFD